MDAAGPLAIAGAIGTINQTVSQDGPGITIATQLNSSASNTNVLAAGGTPANRFRLNSTGSNTNVLAAGATQRSLVRPSLNAALSRPNATSPGRSVLKSISDRITTRAKKFSTQGSLFRPSLNSTPNHPEATSPGRSVLKSISDRITTRAKKFSDTVSRGTDGHAGDAEAGAASTGSSDK